MITRLKIDNFKSLVDFELPPQQHELDGFTCLIGLNGSGKSTLLQAFDFIAQVATGKISAWLEHREWKKTELVSQIGIRRPLIAFEVGMRTADGVHVEWNARYNSNQSRCTGEEIRSNGNILLKVDEGRISVADHIGNLSDTTGEKIQFEYEGSVISQLKLASVHRLISDVKSILQSLRSLELLSPQLMRRKARAANDIGAGGEKLSPFLNQLPLAAKVQLLRSLKQYYPQLALWKIKRQQFGWKNLRISEDYLNSITSDTGHINDGFLRIIAILSQEFTNHQMILLDEIENGINPELAEKMIDFLVGLGKQGKQVIVTTHSPVVLNFLSDDVAKKSVILLYKSTDGRTRSAYYFDQPETGYKLDALGPGEVFVDTNLTQLVSRLANEVAPSAVNSGGAK